MKVKEYRKMYQADREAAGMTMLISYQKRL
jgi:hypothetical protein